ncbi:c-type cytochrome [Zobellella taiwanensis]|jgi:cytochrome c556|uniref:Cytochrome c prime n=1 Tax=Zobellella taiwanensis TaxID=347535 RepID=A0A2P7QSY2_9GAMM|nr:cytochrome c [Zobellella taiwanensis]PSJ41067.1 cytochrome c prime [Zobellella taiwanensis]
MLKKRLILAAVTGLFATTVAAQANLFKPDDAVKYRQSIYQVMSAQTSVMGAMVKGEVDFDAAALHQRALNLGNAASLLGDTYFPETRGESTSNLLDKAWDDMDGFQAKGQAFGSALQDLIAVSGEADFDAAKARPVVTKVLQSCKSCHDDYRK